MALFGHISTPVEAHGFLDVGATIPEGDRVAFTFIKLISYEKFVPHTDAGKTILDGSSIGNT